MSYTVDLPMCGVPFARYSIKRAGGSREMSIGHLPHAGRVVEFERINARAALIMIVSSFVHSRKRTERGRLIGSTISAQV